MPIKLRNAAPVMRKRIYQCTICKTKQVCLTNHERDCWPICIGTCRNTVNADEYNPRREALTQTTHECLGDYNGPLGIHERIK